jgi:hypothetical protein
MGSDFGPEHRKKVERNINDLIVEENYRRQTLKDLDEQIGYRHEELDVAETVQDKIMSNKKHRLEIVQEQVKTAEGDLRDAEELTSKMKLNVEAQEKNILESIGRQKLDDEFLKSEKDKINEQKSTLAQEKVTLVALQSELYDKNVELLSKEQLVKQTQSINEESTLANDKKMQENAEVLRQAQEVTKKNDERYVIVQEQAEYIKDQKAKQEQETQQMKLKHETFQAELDSLTEREINVDKEATKLIEDKKNLESRENALKGSLMDLTIREGKLNRLIHLHNLEKEGVL